MDKVKLRYLCNVPELILTPLYVDDQLLGEIVLGENGKQWTAIRSMLQREGMPAPRRSIGHLYYLPAVLRHFDAREGLALRAFDGPPDGQADFDR